MSKNAMSTGQARSIKLTGDKLRNLFKKQCVNENGKIKQECLIGLCNQYSDATYVLKSGSNWQFHLGSFYPYTDNWGIKFLNQGKVIKYSHPKERIISEVGTFRRLGQLNRPHLDRLCDRHTNEFTTV